MVTRPLPLFSYATTVGIHSSLLLFTALFLPRTSSAIFNDTSNFPFLQPASSLDRPQPEFFEALTASPPLTLAWLCAGVLLISFSWSGRIRRQAYEQHKPTDKTDFEAKEEEMEWQKQGATVRLRLIFVFSSKSQTTVELAQVAHFNTPRCCHLPRVARGLRRPNRQVRHAPGGTHETLTESCSYHIHTFLLALLLSLLTYFPTARVLGTPSIAMFKDGHADVMLRFTWVRIFAEFK